MKNSYNKKSYVVIWQHCPDHYKKASALMTLQQAVKAVLDLEYRGYFSAKILTLE